MTPHRRAVEQCAMVAEAHASIEGIAQTIAVEIRALPEPPPSEGAIGTAEAIVGKWDALGNLSSLSDLVKWVAAALDAARAGPDGFVLVPAEPDEAEIERIRAAMMRLGNDRVMPVSWLEFARAAAAAVRGT